MLKDQPWVNYEYDLSLDWKQSKSEGKDVDYLKDICDVIQERAKDENCKGLATEIWEKFLSAPLSKDFHYIEPSELEEIKLSKPLRRHKLTNSLSENQMKTKLAGAWIGRISGCLLGKPVECAKRDEIYDILKTSNNYPLNRFMKWKDFDEVHKEKLKDGCWADKLEGIAPIDDDTNYTVLAMKLIEVYGKDFKPDDVLEAWLSWVPMFATCTAERVAYRNAASGMRAPETAIYKNPYREWIGAQIRGDFFGYINPADTEKAAEMAWRDAYISHTKNGIYGEMFISAMIAAAFVCDDIMVIIQAGLDEIPEKSRLRSDIEILIRWYEEGVSSLDAIENIHKKFNEYDGFDWCHTNSNAMIVVLGLLYGEKDFGKSICLAVQSAFDTDCNGATVGSIIGIMLGEEQIPNEWYSCYNRKLSTAIIGYTEVSVNELVDKTLSIIKSNIN